MAAVYYNPLTFLYWYDAPEKYAGAPGPNWGFFDECPTTWDETVALSGAIGEHVVVARRSGGRWFLGALTNEQGRRITIPCAFWALASGARRFADGAAGAVPVDTPVVLSQSSVSAADMLTRIWPGRWSGDHFRSPIRLVRPGRSIATGPGRAGHPAPVDGKGIQI
jgi:alpha-glucosidase